MFNVLLQTLIYNFTLEGVYNMWVYNMWVDNLDLDVRKSLSMLSGALNLQPLHTYENESAFLFAVYSKVVEANCLAMKLANALGNRY